jgi:diaminohydroxyphosphoribosylaminopyrimidine deaminase/5-amino-6-(5-phosphoribosylamino)uracil reductase
LVKKGRVVGQGFHARAGEPHAEVFALEQAGTEARESTLYVNLEPCVHYGRTPPCAPRVIEAGVKRAVIGMEDPNPLVKAKGIESLKRAGLDVRVGVLGKECRETNEAFCKYIVEGIPFVILKVASTLDGKIATRNGDSKWITGEVSRRFVHRLRDQADGVLVGIGTILKDDPLLTARVRGAHVPYRIVLDSRLRIPEGAKVFGRDPSRVILVTTNRGPREKVERLRGRGARVLLVDSNQGRVDLKACLKGLAGMGIMTLLVEGGSQVNGSFLEEKAVDKFYLFFAPSWMGDRKAVGIFGGEGMRDLRETTGLEGVRVRRSGMDFLLEGYVAKGRDLCSQG